MYNNTVNREGFQSQLEVESPTIGYRSRLTGETQSRNLSEIFQRVLPTTSSTTADVVSINN